MRSLWRVQFRQHGAHPVLRLCCSSRMRSQWRGFNLPILQVRRVRCSGAPRWSWRMSRTLSLVVLHGATCHRLCLINCVEWSADPQLGDCVICADRMTAVDSIEVPCCRQFAHVVCLARYFSSRGVDCPFCDQSLADFARSSSLLFHGCMIDLDLPPSNQGLNSLVLPSLPSLKI